MTTPQSLIQKTRNLCKAATPGPLATDSPLYAEDGWSVTAGEGMLPSPIAQKMSECDAVLFAAAPTLLLELAEALQVALRAVVDDEGGREMHRQLIVFSGQITDLKTELAKHKAKMPGFVADAYAKGRASNEDTDDRTSEHD